MATWVDLPKKPTEVQEAAAAAVEAENTLMAGKFGLTAEQLSGSRYFDLPYPYDPYDLEQIDKVPDYFEWLDYRTPSSLDEKVESLKDASKTLRQAATAHSQDTFKDYRGYLIEDLNDYLVKMNNVAKEQSVFADELREPLLNLQKFLSAASEDVESAANGAIEALNNIADGGNGDGGKRTDVALALLGLSITVIGTFATGGSTIAAAFAFASGGLNVATAAAKTEKVADPTVDGVLNKMFSAIDDVHTDLTDKEDELIRLIGEDDAAVDNDRHILEPNRPEASDRLDETKYTGNGDLLYNLAKLRYYAQENMPHMASDFGKGNRSVADAAGPAGAHALGSVYEPWVALCTRLQRLSGRTSQNIFDAADVVAQATLDLARADGITAEELNAAVRERDTPEHDHDRDDYTPDDRVEPVMPEKQESPSGQPQDGNSRRAPL